jgi:hypothetical protein
MTATLDITPEVRRTPAPAAARTGDISRRLAGFGALTFVVTVLGQNLVRGATAPANGASPQEVLDHYAAHSAVTSVLVGMFVISGLGLVVFLGGAMRDLMSSARRGWALTGFVGGIAILSLFSFLVAAETALTVIAGHDHPSLGAVEAIWALHNSVFVVLLFAISVALLGLSRAGIVAGVTPPAYRRLAPIGSAMLLVGVVSGPSIAAGDLMVLFAVSAVGFLIWLSFLVATGLRLVKASDGALGRERS